MFEFMAALVTDESKSNHILNFSLSIYYLGRISSENAKFEFSLYLHRTEFDIETVSEFEF